jgi:hypothetical protein
MPDTIEAGVSSPFMGDVPTLADLVEAIRAVPAVPQMGDWWHLYGELVGWLQDHPEFAPALPAEIERLRAENAKLRGELRYAKKGPRYGS